MGSVASSARLLLFEEKRACNKVPVGGKTIWLMACGAQNRERFGHRLIRDIIKGWGKEVLRPMLNTGAFLFAHREAKRQR